MWSPVPAVKAEAAGSGVGAVAGGGEKKRKRRARASGVQEEEDDDGGMEVESRVADVAVEGLLALRTQSSGSVSGSDGGRRSGVSYSTRSTSSSSSEGEEEDESDG